MRLFKALRIASVGLILLLGASIVAARDESEQPTSAQERSDAQKAARQFVKRMQQTRDVNPLIRELFVPNFISHFVSGDYQDPEFCARLSQSERRRWFVVQNNLSYLITLDVLNSPNRNPSDPEYDAQIFKSILPERLAERLGTLGARRGENDFQCRNYHLLRSILVRAEKALAEARAHLLKTRLESTPEFQKQLDDKVTNIGVNYRVRAYVGGENVKDCPTLIGFPPQQKFYRVEIPLMMGVILVKRGRQMKIVTLTYVDGD